MGGIGSEQVSPRVVSGILRAVDFLIVLGCALFSFWAYHPDVGETSSQYIVVVAAAVLLQVHLFQFAGLYRFEKFGELQFQLGRLLAAWSLTFFALVTVAFLTKVSADYSRGWALIWFVAVLFALTILRVALYFRIRVWIASGRLLHNIAIVGAGENGRRLVQYLNGAQGGNFSIIGIFDDRASRVPEMIEGYRRAGTVDDLLRFARNERIDQILVALPWSAEERHSEILRKLKTLPVDVRLSPDLIGFSLLHSSFGRIGAIPTVEVSHKPLSDWKLLTKEFEDLILGALVLLFITPLLLLIAIAVKLDSPGPILFRQKRYGFNNQVIEVCKFRSMRVDACQDVTVPQATRNDPRITSIGRFLRRSSLDELPQIINVLRGEMSLVGPRPHAVLHNEQFAQIIDEYAARHRVKPGITGWAQVNGWRGETDTVDKMRKRVEHDIHYIDNWSISFDLKILLMTPILVRRGDNAY
jgi:Undecaprenyl-phosphate glucose phosphotransferase